MPLRLSFNLGDRDLEHFEEVAQQTQAIARAQPEEEIVAAARRVLERGPHDQGAQFVRERYSRLQAMIEMATDAEWGLTGDDRQRALNALACFSAPGNDTSPTYLLDHAIMIELVSRDLHHDLIAYREFSRFKESLESKRRKADPAIRDQLLQKRRDKLHVRMHERRKRDLDRAGGSVRRLFSLFGL